MSITELLTLVAEQRERFDTQKTTVTALEGLEQLRVTFLGRKGAVSALRAKIKTVDVGLRKEFGAALNALHKHIENEINTLRAELEAKRITAKLRNERADIDLPVLDDNERGALHPVSLMRHRLQEIFCKLGFTVLEGPELEFSDFNFNKLNIPDHHPARDMQDTFYLRDYPRLVLRTHTSNVQVHAMSDYSPPLRVISMGRCFRCDFDLTHTPMFHQMEGFMIDEGITFAHLKGTIDTFLRAVYGDEMRTRFRPSYFPFVEPGAEVDIGCVSCAGDGCRVCKRTGWVEVAGCGMIHPEVFEGLNIDSEKYTGYAFGFGIDRLAMLYFGISDLRLLFAGQEDFLRKFPVFI